MTSRFQDYKDKLRIVHHMSLRKVENEYRVNFMTGKSDNENTAYYTDDLEDAFSIAIDMRLRDNKRA